jgi:hypothetical protein
MGEVVILNDDRSAPAAEGTSVKEERLLPQPRRCLLAATAILCSSSDAFDVSDGTTLRAASGFSSALVTHASLAPRPPLVQPSCVAYLRVTEEAIA